MLATRPRGCPRFLKDASGLINEPCATYLIHDSSISTSIAADDRIDEFDQAMKEISAIAARLFRIRHARSGQEAQSDISGLSGHGYACSLSPRGRGSDRCFQSYGIGALF